MSSVKRPSLKKMRAIEYGRGLLGCALQLEGSRPEVQVVLHDIREKYPWPVTAYGDAAVY